LSIEIISTNCLTKSIECEQVTERNLLKIKIPKARAFKYITLNEGIAQFAVERNINFLDYRFIEGYEAIWSQEHDVIECEIELPQRGFVFDRIFRSNKDVSEAGKLIIDTHLTNVKVELSEVSYEFHLLDIYKDTARSRPMMDIERFDRRKNWATSLKITGVNVTSHDKAKEIIETIFHQYASSLTAKQISH